MYKVEFTESAVKQLKKLDKQTVRVIKNWVIKNLVNTPDPRLHGKALKGNLKGIWRYRVGDYRLFASIEEEIITISIFEIGHRRDIYKEYIKLDRDKSTFKSHRDFSSEKEISFKHF